MTYTTLAARRASLLRRIRARSCPGRLQQMQAEVRALTHQMMSMEVSR